LAVWHSKKSEWTKLYADSSVNHIAAMGNSLVFAGIFNRIGGTEATAINSPSIAMLTGEKWTTVLGLSGQINGMVGVNDSILVFGTLKIEIK